MYLNRLWCASFAVLMFSARASGGSLSSIVVYGDSLSDNGNLFATTGQPGSPYYMGRRSNGPVTVEQLAALSAATLKDYAWIGATTGIGNYGDNGTPTSFGTYGLPGMLTELKDTQSQISAYKGGLFVVWGGPNDFLSPSPSDRTPQQQIARAVGDLVTIVDTLKGDGAKNILVPGMPDLGLTPYFLSLGSGASAQATALTNAFNATLASELPSGVKYYDTAGLLRSIVADPSAYGFTDVRDPCFNGSTVCADPSKYLFFDSFHPTTQADAFLAEGFDRTLTPEPAGVTLLTVGLIVLGCVCRNRLVGERRHEVHEHVR